MSELVRTRQRYPSIKGLMVVLLQAVVSGALMGLFYALLAAGFALIFGVVRVFNLAHGELVLIGAYLGYGLWALGGLDPLWSMPVAAAFLILVGFLVHRVLSRTSEPFELNTLVLTFGFSLLFQNLLLILMSGNYRLVVAQSFEQAFVLGPVSVSIGRLVVGVVSLISLGTLSFLLRGTYMGKVMRATSQDREAASLMGINVARIDLYVFAIGTGIAGMAGPLYATLHYVQPAAGVEATLIALILTIFGGVGRMEGLLLGGLIFGLTESLTVALIGSQWKELLAFMVLILLLRARSVGLLPGKVY
ncbi:MAG: branched-chain amino acid ABC transporter permease [candidate division NC10 bacterium]|nr:branched-chain amino acid ABC transporter permease [candidate division NC10 bacterium]